MNMNNLALIIQQLQQLQIQQNNAAASVNTLGPLATYNIMNDIRAQQEQLINKYTLSKQQQQQNIQLASSAGSSKISTDTGSTPLTDIDPAILGAAPASNAASSKLPQAVWQDGSG
jgi:hypothetical protein